MSNITPSEEISSKADNSKTNPLEVGLFTKSRTSRGSVFIKDILLKTVALALFVYGGYLTIVSKEIESGMAAIGASVAVATAKLGDEKEQILDENQILNAYLSREIEYARLEAQLNYTEKIHNLELSNLELYKEIKYLKGAYKSAEQDESEYLQQGDKLQGDNLQGNNLQGNSQQKYFIQGDNKQRDSQQGDNLQGDIFNS